MSLRDAVGPLTRNRPPVVSGDPQPDAVTEPGLFEDGAIRPLTAAEWVEAVRLWDRVQRTADRDPAGAIEEAHWLMHQLMCARGFPMAEFQARQSTLEESYPALIGAYRESLAVYVARIRGELDPQDLDGSFGTFRTLFAELIDADAIRKRAIAAGRGPSA